MSTVRQRLFVCLIAIVMVFGVVVSAAPNIAYAESGGRNNEKIYPNPNPKDDKPMYIGKRVRHDDKDNFEDFPLPWKYPKK